MKKDLLKEMNSVPKYTDLNSVVVGPVMFLQSINFISLSMSSWIAKSSDVELKWWKWDKIEEIKLETVPFEGRFAGFATSWRECFLGKTTTLTDKVTGTRRRRSEIRR